MVHVQELFGYFGLLNLYDFQMERTHNRLLGIILLSWSFISYNNAFRCRVAAECHWTESFVEFPDSQSIGEVVLLNGFVREECSFRLFLACNISAQYFCGKFYVKLLSRDHLMFLFERMEIPKTMLCFGEIKLLRRGV